MRKNNSSSLENIFKVLSSLTKNFSLQVVSHEIFHEKYFSKNFLKHVDKLFYKDYIWNKK